MGSVNYSITFFLVFPFINTNEPKSTKISPKNSLIVNDSPNTITDKIEPKIGINNLNTPNLFAEWFCSTIVHIVNEVAVIKAPYNNIIRALDVK